MKNSLTRIACVMLWFLVMSSPALCDIAITNIVLTPGSPAWLAVDQGVSIAFDYESDQPAGIYIYTTPFTDGVPTPGNIAAGSPLYRDTTGSGASSFRIIEGEVTVDSVRFQIYNSNHSQLLYQSFLPVLYFYVQHMVTDIACYPPSPATIGFTQPIDVTFTYSTDEPSGVRIFVRPFTNGQLTPWYEAHNSPVYPTGTGVATGSFTILHGEVTVDSLRFQMRTADMSTLLLQTFCPVEYLFTSPLDADDPADIDDFPASMLLQNHGNPFGITTTIEYSLKRPGIVTITVYNILGQKVRTLVDDSKAAGLHEVSWNGRDDSGERVSNGIYLYRIVSGDFSDSKKMILFR
ncbi:MAG: FlgD immunoglobulin-like domain containing protein [Candidatus Zixiibacteriota bacterium]